MRFLFLAVLSVVSLFGQSRFVYRTGDVTVTSSDVNSMIIFSGVRSRDIEVKVASSKTTFAVGAKVYFLALTDVPIKLSASGTATLISPNDAYTVASYGSQWVLTHLGRNVWVLSGDVYSTELDGYLDDDISMKARIDPKATGPFKFVWTKNGAVIAGATSATLKFQRLKYTDAGVYSVTVSNSAGVVSSEALRLTVR